MPRLNDAQIDQIVDLLRMFAKYGDPAFVPAIQAVIRMLEEVEGTRRWLNFSA